MIARYVHALDARDYDILDDVFVPEARFDLTEAGGIAGSWIEVKRFYRDNLETFIDYQHVFSNVLLEFDVGRHSARSRSKVINPCGMLGGDGKLHHFEVIGLVRGRLAAGAGRMADHRANLAARLDLGRLPASRAARGVHVTQRALRGDLIGRTIEHAGYSSRPSRLRGALSRRQIKLYNYYNDSYLNLT